MTGIAIFLFFVLAVGLMLCGMVLFCRGADQDPDWMNEMDDEDMDDLDLEYRQEIDAMKKEKQ